jgi:hypothetical protein
MTRRVVLLPEEPQASAVPTMVTEWESVAAPPSSGFWELRVDEEPEVCVRGWFDHAANVWIIGAKTFTMQDFRNGELAWRGLVKPAHVYPYVVG